MGNKYGTPTKHTFIQHLDDTEAAIADAIVYRREKIATKEGGGRGRYSIESLVYDYIKKKYHYDSQDHWQHACAIINRL